MEPFYFGDAREPLFGIRHAAQGTPRRSAVLICPSWGMEYLRAYRGLRSLAQLLAAKGYEVLRFDYACTGDSAGDSGAASWPRWLDDSARAAQELRELSGASRIALFGLRFGALVAASAARAQAQDLVLWDLPASGNEYVQQMRSLETALEGERQRQRTASARLDAPSADELLGHAWPAALDEALRALTPPAQPAALHLASEDQPAAEGALRLPDAARWQTYQRLSTPWQPQVSLRQVVERICERLP